MICVRPIDEELALPLGLKDGQTVSTVKEIDDVQNSMGQPKIRPVKAQEPSCNIFFTDFHSIVVRFLQFFCTIT